MRTVLVMLIAIDLAILAVAYAPAFEAVHGTWCTHAPGGVALSCSTGDR